MSGLFFGWVNPLVTRGAAQTQLQYDDLLPTATDSTPQRCTYDLWNEWTKLCTEARPSLLNALVGAYGSPYFALGILKLLNDALTFAGAILLNLLVKQLEHATSAPPAAAAATPSSHSSSSSVGGLVPGWIPRPGDPYWGFVLAALLGFSAVAKAIIGSHYNYRLSVITVRLRSGVMGVLFRSALLTRSCDSSGDVSTLMAVDTGRLANICVSFHELWSLPLQIAAAMWLLYTQVRTAFIAGVVLCVALVPINRLIAQRIQAASSDLMSSKDSRVALMGEVLRHIGVVKALGWEQVLGDKIRGYRDSELSALAVRKYLDALCVYFWAATQLLLSGTTFTLMVLLGQQLKPSVVFTCLALFNVLIAPINAFPWVINGVVEAVVSLRRIQGYLLLPQRAIGWAYSESLLPQMLHFQQQQQQQQEFKDGFDQRSGAASLGKEVAGYSRNRHWQQQQQQQHRDSMLARYGSSSNSSGGGSRAAVLPRLERGVTAQFHNATLTWRKGLPPCLHDLQLSIPAGCLTAVVGEVGSGKSSLLAALLGELGVTQGLALLPNRQIIRSGFTGSVPQGSPLDPGFTGQHDLRSDHNQIQNPDLGSQIRIDQIQGLRSPDLGSDRLDRDPRLVISSSSGDGSGAKPWRPARVSYVSQSPWLMRGTVRDNILMGQPYDAEFMVEILHAVGLDQDLAAMPSGDLTQTGDGGSALSGGQRVRVALARALYQADTDVFLLDDVLASLDSHVAQWVIRHTLFGGLLEGATVVLVTKHPLVIQSAQLVIGLQHGRVAYCGSPQGFAHWKATQTLQSTAANGAANTEGWKPLIRPTSPRPRSQHLASLSLPSHTSHPSSHSPQGTSHQTSHRRARQGGVNLGVNLREKFPSEDVAPSELLLAGSHGVWASHASVSPQLNVISEDGSLSREQSLSLSSSVLGSQEARSAAAAAAKDQQQQQVLKTAAAAGTWEQQQRQQHAEVVIADAVQPTVADSSSSAAAAAMAHRHHSDLNGDHSSDGSSGDDQQQQHDGEESRAIGAVHWAVYKSYMKAVGVFMCITVFVSLILMQATKNGIDLWVTRSLTSAHNTSDSYNSFEVTAAVVSWQPLPSAAAAGSLAAAAAVAPKRSMISESPPAAAAAAAAVQQALYKDTLGHSLPLFPHQQQQQHLADHHQQQHRIDHPHQQQHTNQQQQQQLVRSPQIRWHPSTLSPDMILFLKGLAVIAGLNTLATLARAFSFAAAGMAAARITHELLLAAVLGARMSFFDHNAAGRILNRFSSDTSMIDDSLPFILNILLANAVSLAGLLMVLLLGQPVLLLLLLPLGVAYRRLQVYYRSSARELRRLEAAGLSPLYGGFGDVVAGAATIRAAAAQQHFMKRFLSAMCPYQAACLNSAAAANWLAARLQLLAAVLLSAVAAVAAAAAAAGSSSDHGATLHIDHHHSSGVLDRGPSFQTLPSWILNVGSSSSTFRINLLGLALAYCLPIVQLLNGLLTSSAEMEQEMVSVERVMVYLNEITPEEQQQQQQQQQRSQPSQQPQQQQQQQQQQHLSPAKVKRLQRQQWRWQRIYGQQQQQQGELQQPLLPDPGSDRPAEAAAAAIEFRDVVMRYGPGLPAALRGVSFRVEYGQKLGICGRTGAGKSSILAALLRLRPTESGFILVMGDDSSTMMLQDLRNRFGVVPQSPVLFSGTLRDNLDPAAAANDEQLAAALQAVHMWGALCSIALHHGVLGHSTYLMARRTPAYSKNTSNQQSMTAAAGSSQAAAAAGGISSDTLDARFSLDDSGLSQDMQAVPNLGDLLQPEAAATTAADDLNIGPNHDDRLLDHDLRMTSAALYEGAAAAIGAAAGRAAAAAASPRSAAATPRSAAATTPSRRSQARSPFAAAAAAASVLLSPRRGSSRASTWDFPPVPMYPASKVLSMKVGGASGLQLSAGQSQLVCLARVLLKRAPLVLLDEATAAVDQATAALIHQVLHEQLDVHPDNSSSSSKPTVLQVAHELSAIKAYDQVVVMSGGRVVETGNPAELAARQDSKFASLLAQSGQQHGPGQQQQQLR